MSSLSYQNITPYGSAPAPSTAKSVGLSLIRPAFETQLALGKAQAWALGVPLDTKLKDTVDLINYQLSNPGISSGQSTANTVAGLAGMVLDPISLILGGVGGKLAGAGFRGLAGIVPDAISGFSANALSREAIDTMIKTPFSFENKFAKFLPKSFHDLLEASTESAGLMSGFTLPESFVKNYNEDTNRLNYGGLIKSITINGGIGFAIPPVTWLAGITGAKIFEGMTPDAIKALTTKEKLALTDKALEAGKITEEDHAWYKNYHENPGDETGHHARARDILLSSGHPVNAVTGSIDLPFLTQQEMNHLQSFAVDEMASSTTTDYRTALSDFVTHGALDRMTSMLQKNPAMLDGIKGYLDSMIERVGRKAEGLERGDVVIERTLGRAAERQQPITQSRLYNMMREGNLSHREMPFIVPDNIRKINERETEIKALERKSKDYEREFNKTNRTKFKKLKDKVDKKIEEKRSILDEYKLGEGKIKTQAQELKAIEDRLIGGESLPLQYRTTKEYLRLLDLATVSPKARGLVEKIKLRERYEMQAAYNTVLGNVVKIAEAGMDKYAKPERVINYLKERIEGASDIAVTEKSMTDRVQEVNKEARETVELKLNNIEEARTALNESEHVSRETKEEFNVLSERLRQFKDADKALNEMVNCIMEAENVGI